MPSALDVMYVLGIAVVLAPTLLVAALGLPTLVNEALSERWIVRLCQAATSTGLLSALAILVLMLATGERHIAVELGHWVDVPGYHFSVKFLFDRLSVPMVILSFVLCGTIGAFAGRYMHREPGFNRFFALFALFLLGMVAAALAGTIETLFAGWELVGLSSALLVAFFQERPAPARNGLRIWSIYRFSDAALLIAAVIMHHLTGEGDFDQLMGAGPWPAGQAAVTPLQALFIGLLLVVAAAGKSALIPFSGWLPRAMEGPTPSSAIFYGALSVHLGAFMLLRAGPLLEASPWLAGLVVFLGLATAIYAYLASSVQTDVKSALSFACISQVGLIVAETGLGWRYIALVHLLGHACLRTLQFVRAPTALQDQRIVENAIGRRPDRSAGPLAGLAPASWRHWIYRWALERGYLDALLNDYIFLPFQRLFRWFDRLERRWTDFLTGGTSRESEPILPTVRTINELT